MRRIVTLVAIATFISLTSYSQTVKLQLKTGEEKVVAINATGSDALYIAGGSIKFKDIASITFSKIEEASAKLQADLKKAGVNVLVDGVEREPIKVVPTITETSASIEGLDRSIEQFRIQRNNGKTAQLVGILAIGGSVLLQSIYNKQYEKDLEDYLSSPSGSLPEPKYVSPAISAAGLVLFTIGLGVDLDAGKHLKKKR